MRLVERHIVKGAQFYDLCVRAKNLYNQALYYWRQSIFGNIQYFGEYELSGLFAKYNEETFRALPSSTGQQIIKLLFKNIKSWQKVRKEYKANPGKFSGRPKMPGYKKEVSIAIFTSAQARVKNGYIHFPKGSNLPPIKTGVDKVRQVRIVPNSDHFIVEVVYEKQEKPLREYNGNWMGIDLGLNNLATVATKEGAFIINGKPLKSMNHWYNKRKRKLQSQLPEGRFNSKRITQLTNKRNRKVDDYMHKASKMIVGIAKVQDITKIVIGLNEGWKQNLNVGKKTNRHFTAVPHSAIVAKIAYKGLLDGTEVLKTQEAYTSKCSALDLEPIQKHETYVGKRKKRGLFVTSTGFLMNADHNGALNIARLGLNASGNQIPVWELVSSAALAPIPMAVL